MKHSDGLAALKASANDNSVMARFLGRVSPAENDNGCWVWTGGKSGGNGYGVMRVDGKQQYAHRVSHELFKGPIPKGKMVLHTCDCRDCVNPAHEYTGDHAQNVADAIERERYSRGGKLRAAQVLAIVHGIDAGKTHIQMSDKFHVSVESIARIMQGKTYSKLTGIKPTAPKFKAEQKAKAKAKAKRAAHN